MLVCTETQNDFDTRPKRHRHSPRCSLFSFVRCGQLYSITKLKTQKEQKQNREKKEANLTKRKKKEAAHNATRQNKARHHKIQTNATQSGSLGPGSLHAVCVFSFFLGQVRGVWVLASTGTEAHDRFRRTLPGDSERAVAGAATERVSRLGLAPSDPVSLHSAVLLIGLW